ncbi:hypothetical protein LAZ67_10000934 [Cordylochernes scorpioides]|uniref:DUF5641 domain-containing protein n=1 Tax=Cordylochernes scorpioides TaxID=51811 RepID=A0ABY6KYS6_9ARAC|nr:hypothetical protein LAZ67_10000934 [Cordylochernes scorpioides]
MSNLHGTVLKKWKRSWAELTSDGLLKYYETEASSSPEGVINLRTDGTVIKMGKLVTGIKCFKYHFRRIIGETLLTYEELLTLVVQIESCLNSRPLGPIGSDPNNLEALTPAHFLLTSSSSCVPKEDLLNVGVQLLPRWKMVQKMVQHLWRRWSADYIHNIQQRHKWRMLGPDVATGSLVLIREEHVPPRQVDDGASGGGPLGQRWIGTSGVNPHQDQHTQKTPG